MDLRDVIRAARGRIAMCAATIALAVVAVGCGGNDDDGSGDASSGEGGTVAFLLKESKTARWEGFDRPYFTERLEQVCPKCKLVYGNANQDAARQQQQAEAALTQGAKVLVITPVDSKAAAAIAKRAKQAGVPVIAYDALINDAPIDYFVSFQNEKVGELQGRALVEKLERDGTGDEGEIVMINGSPTDANAGQFKTGAHAAIDGNVKIGKEYDTPDWSPDKAQQEMEQAITTLGKDKIVGVYAANDGTAGGAIAAMKGYGMDPAKIPVTGQDAELAAIQRIVAGEQYMTVYKAIRPEANAAADLAVALLKGEKPKMPSTIDNGAMDVPAKLLRPVAVTRANIAQTVVKDGFYTVSQICGGRFAAACKKAGVRGG